MGEGFRLSLPRGDRARTRAFRWTDCGLAPGDPSQDQGSNPAVWVHKSHPRLGSRESRCVSETVPQLLGRLIEEITALATPRRAKSLSPL